MTHEIIPLSALPEVRVTEETQAELARVGIPCPEGCTELAAQHLLLLRHVEVPDAVDRPACFGLRHEHRDPVCVACLWQPRCVALVVKAPLPKAKTPPPLPGRKP